MASAFWNLDTFDLLAASTVGDELLGFRWIVAIWLFCFGACFGSLLNVIVYRWPAGMSIIVPRSRCPRCGHGIRSFDNVPVLSWFVLRGRCRDCQTPIAGRYPAVEALIGFVFLALVLVEVFPSIVHREEHHTTLLWIRYLSHLVLLYSLIAAALIQSDHQRVPLRVYLIVLVVGMFLPVLVSWLDSDADWWAGLSTRLGGFAMGGLFALLTMPAVGRDWTNSESHFFLLALCGLVLGWPAVMLTACCVSLLMLLAVFERRLRTNVMRFPAAGFLAIGVLLVLIYWSQLDQLPWLASFQAFWVFAPLMLCASLVARRLDD